MLQTEMRDVQAVLRGWRSGGGSKVAALAAALERGLIAGELDQRLPAERELASLLGVSRGTVTAAYAQLKDRQLIFSRPGAATRPDAESLRGPVRTARLGARGMVNGTILGNYVDRALGGLDLSFTVLDVPESVREIVAQAYATALTEPSSIEHRAAGLTELRESIAAWYSRSLQLATTSDQIIITQGAYQGIVLATLLTLQPGDCVVAETPMYPGALDTFRAHDASIRTVDTFGDDCAVAALESDPSRIGMLYATSVARNPNGALLNQRSAAQLARFAERNNIVTIDDRALEWCDSSGRLSPPLAKYAPNAPILTLGSIDKTTGAGTRIGWVRAPYRFAEKLVRLKALSDFASPAFMQRVAFRLVENIDLIGVARRSELRQRRDHLTSLLRAACPQWTWPRTQGGLSLWVDTGAPAQALVEAAAKEGLTLVGGAAFVPNMTNDRHIRIAFTQPPELLSQAIERLATIVRKL